MEVRMTKIFAVAALALAVAGCAANQPADPRAEQNNEARLAAALNGYAQSGPPVSCVQMRDLGGNRSVGDAIVFDGNSSAAMYVNRPAAACPSLEFGRALVIRTTQSQLCRGDIATVVDPTTRTEYGGCGLGDFTPYRRVARP
jgi:hypothetical protein